MQETLRGIVLRTVKYGDTSMVVDLFTESHGRQSFMASTARAKRSVRSKSFWQPLSMVEFSAEMRPVGGLPRPSDVRTYYNYTDLPFSPVKSTLALFLAEFLSAALREEKENTPLYRYIESSLQWLDMVDKPIAVANFHLAFLMHLSRFIGIYPNLEWAADCRNRPARGLVNSQLFFDLLAGSYCDRQPPHAHFLRRQEAQALPVLFRMDYPNLHLFRLSRQERMRILQVLNEYYRLHVPNFPELKSLEVLQEFYS
jgi:DNA repair protein RecO (recombination protein O)